MAGDFVSLSGMEYKIYQRLLDCECIIGIFDKKINRTVYQNNTTIITQVESNIGIRKLNLVSSAKGEWILLLDTDEVVSPELSKEIREVIKITPSRIHGYEIYYQNYVFGSPVYYGGEKYGKVRLFRRKYGTVTQVPIHEEVIVKGKIGKLKNVLHHYSYRSPWQVITKFTRYAWLLAAEKQQIGEQLTLSKLFFYGLHMFWARCIEDEGWKDGWRGVVLAFLFGYMESMIYWLLLWRNLSS